MSDKALPEGTEAVLAVAEDFFRRDPDWVTFYREILGVAGAARLTFSTPERWTQFEQTDAYHQVQLMLAKLRDQSGSKPEFQDATRVITVRLPRSLHDSLRDEARERRTSMNQLCISKLLQIIDDALVPAIE